MSNKYKETAIEMIIDAAKKRKALCYWWGCVSGADYDGKPDVPEAAKQAIEGEIDRLTYEIVGLAESSLINKEAR